MLNNVSMLKVSIINRTHKTISNLFYFVPKSKRKTLVVYVFLKVNNKKENAIITFIKNVLLF